MNYLNSIGLSLFVVACLVSPVSASEIPTQEIIVINKSIYDIRRELRAAETRMADIFNDLIEDDQFKIICKKNKRAGSYIGRWGCEPNFVIQARTRDFQKGQMAFGLSRASEFVRSNRQLNYSFADKRVEMESLIVDLAVENPELYDAILEARDLKADYELARELRFGKE